MTETLLHPVLQPRAIAHRRLLRWLRLLLFLTVSGVMLFGMATAFTRGDVASLLQLGLIGMVMLPVITLLGGLIWWVDRWQVRRLSTANHLLQDCAPVMARLTPTGPTSHHGMLVTIQPAAGAPPLALYALIYPTFRASRLLRQAITVSWYCRDQQPGNELVAVHEGYALLGRLVDGPAYGRRMQLTTAIALALTLIMAVVTGGQAVDHYVQANLPEAILLGAVVVFLLATGLSMLNLLGKYRRLERP